LENQTLNPDIQKSIMQAGALLKGKKAYDWLEKRFQISESEHESMNVLMAIGCFVEKEMVEKALRFTLDNVPPRNKFIPIMSATGNPYAIPFMWDWYLSHIEELETFHPLLYERVIAAIIPICGIKDPNAVTAFFTDYIKDHAELKDTVQMSLERLEINVRLRNRS
jgi:tricorn protease interacting factor F2/3